jgi:hypothetical protein
MWMTLNRKIQLSIIVTTITILIIAIQSVLEIVSGSPSSPIRFGSLLVTIVGTVLVAGFNFCWRFVWSKIPILSKLIFPDLNGTWTGPLQTTWRDPVTGMSPGPIDTTVWIKQDLFNFSIQQQTKESLSWSTRVFAEADKPSDRFRLWFSYDNRPHAKVAYRSPDHEGVCSLEMNVDRSKSDLQGQYFTSRSTSGNIQLSKVSSKLTNLPDRKLWPGGALSHFDS